MSYSITSEFILLNSLLNNIRSINQYNLIEYNDSMTPDQLTEIALKNLVNNDIDNMKICFSMAIEKNHTPAMLHFARYYEQIESNIEEMIRLYLLAIEHNNKDGAFSLANYYKSKNDVPNILKYLNIGVDKFNDQDSMLDLINYYNTINDEVNSVKYCDKLIEHNLSHGHFIKGKTFQIYKKYSEMKNHYDQFLNSLDSTTIMFNTEELNLNEKHCMYIIKFYMDNDINLPLVQYILHKLNISTPSILGHLQFKLNKAKLKDPIYNKIGSCGICFNDDVTLQLFDCLGHYYCSDCTINMDKCAICRCTKKCGHM